MPSSSEPLALGDDFLQDPHSVYARLNRQGPIHRVLTPTSLSVTGGQPVWLITGYGEVRDALADPRLSTDLNKLGKLFSGSAPDKDKRGAFSSSLGTHMVNTDPPDHTRLRRLVNKAFTAGAVERLRPRIEQITTGLLDELAARGPEPVDLIEAFAFPLPVKVICLILGIPPGEEDAFGRWSRALTSGGTRQETAEASTSMIAFLHRLVARKRAEPADDVLSALIAARDEGDGLSETELVSTAFVLFIGGHETTVNTLANGTYHLMRNPRQWRALLADRSLVPAAVEEFLRLESPLKHATFRSATEPITVGGARIDSGDIVLLAVAAANRDPGRFADPDDLDVTRSTAGHVAFGHGIHYCLGAPLARMEAQIAFDGLLDRFPRLELAAAAEELSWRTSIMFRGLHALPVRLNRS